MSNVTTKAEERTRYITRDRSCIDDHDQCETCTLEETFASNLVAARHRFFNKFAFHRATGPALVIMANAKSCTIEETFVPKLVSARHRFSNKFDFHRPTHTALAIMTNERFCTLEEIFVPNLVPARHRFCSKFAFHLLSKIRG